MKKKLMLSLDALTVETFATTGQAAGRGTVLGHSGECGSSGMMRCFCDDSPADPTFVNETCQTGMQDGPCMCHQGPGA
jgi:hypothetical protein